MMVLSFPSHFSNEAKCYLLTNCRTDRSSLTAAQARLITTVITRVFLTPGDISVFPLYAIHWNNFSNRYAIWQLCNSHFLSILLPKSENLPIFLCHSPISYFFSL